MDTKDLVMRAKNDEGEARVELIRYIHQERMLNVLSKYIRKSKFLEPQDIISEFWYGLFKALPSVNPEIGDPIHYLLWKGKMHVIDVLRKATSNNVKYLCKECGKEGNLYMKNNVYVCRDPKCNSEDINTTQRESNITSMIQTDYDMTVYDSFTPKQVRINFVEIDIELVKPLLSPQQLRVFELMQEGIKGDNYIKAIADIMNIRPQSVSLYIKNIRKKIRGRI